MGDIEAGSRPFLFVKPRLSKALEEESRVRTVATRRGVRIVQNGIVLSEVLDRPGPTHSVVDVMAAAVCGFHAGPRLALLGFEGGGMLAPLRAMGGVQSVDAVDTSRRSEPVFEMLCRKWCGEVRFHHQDAEAWLCAARGPFDGIIEDISISRGEEVVQPEAVWTILPQLVRHRLSSEGVAVFNLLKPVEIAWNAAIGQVVKAFRTAHVVLFDDFENRLVIGGNHGLSAREISARMRQELKRIRSRLADRISVGTYLRS